MPKRAKDKRTFTPLEKASDKKQNSLTGFTLVEIVVAALILAVAIGGMWASFVASTRHTIRAKARLMALHNAEYILEKLRADVRADTWDDSNLSIGDHAVTDWLPEDDPGSFRNKYNGKANYTVADVTGSDARKVELTVKWDDIE